MFWCKRAENRQKLTSKYHIKQHKERIYLRKKFLRNLFLQFTTPKTSHFKEVNFANHVHFVYVFGLIFRHIKRLSQVALPLRLPYKVFVWAAYGSDQQVLRNTFFRI